MTLPHVIGGRPGRWVFGAFPPVMILAVLAIVVEALWPLAVSSYVDLNLLILAAGILGILRAFTMPQAPSTMALIIPLILAACSIASFQQVLGLTLHPLPLFAWPCFLVACVLLLHRHGIKQPPLQAVKVIRIALFISMTVLAALYLLPKAGLYVPTHIQDPLLVLCTILAIFSIGPRGDKQDSTQRDRDSAQPSTCSDNRRSLQKTIIVALIVLLALGFSMHHLGKFMTIDEVDWRASFVPNYIEAWTESNLDKTYFLDKPGTPVAMLAAISQSLLPADYTWRTAEHWLFWWRLPQVLASVLLLLVIHHYLRKMFNRTVALVALALIALHPVIIGLTQIVNPDGLGWSVPFIALLAFFCHLRSGSRTDLLVAGIATGIAVATKYFHILLYYVFIIAALIEWLAPDGSNDKLRERLRSIATLFLISLATFATFLPASWLSPALLISLTLGRDFITRGYFIMLPALTFVLAEALLTKGALSSRLRTLPIIPVALGGCLILGAIGTALLVGNTSMGSPFFNADAYTMSLPVAKKTQTSLDASWLGGYNLLYTLTPLMIIGLLLYATFFFIGTLRRDIPTNVMTSAFFVLILMYILGSTMGSFALMPRYAIILYPLFATIAALGICSIPGKNWLPVAAVALSVVTLVLTAPFYLNYYNILNTDKIVVSEAWGLGAYELAQEANKMPGAENITVWMDRAGFSDFFAGQTIWRNRGNPFSSATGVDYLILSRGGERTMRKSAKEYEEGKRNVEAVIAGTTPLLTYYNATALATFCVQKNNCVRMVPLTPWTTT